MILIGIYSSYYDFKKGIIPNIAIIIGVICSIAGNSAVIIINGISGFPMFLFNLFSAIAIAFLMYVLRIWAGGDVKLFVLFAALTPTVLLKQNIPLPEVIVYVIVFSLAFIYILIQSIFFIIKKEKAIVPKQKFSIVPFLSCVFFIMSVQFILRFAFKSFYVEYIGVFLFLNVILVLLFGKIRFLHNIVVVIICAVICISDIVLSITSGKAAFDYRSLLIVLAVILFRFLAERYNYQEINTKDVKKGMVLSYATVFQFSKSRVKGLPETATEDMASRITQDEADSIIRWESSKTGQKTIVILRKIPFAVFISAGYLIYIILGEFLW